MGPIQMNDWVYITNETGDRRFVGFVVDWSITKIKVHLTQPVGYEHNGELRMFGVVEFERKAVMPCRLVDDTIHRDDLTELIDYALAIGDREWFNQLSAVLAVRAWGVSSGGDRMDE